MGALRQSALTPADRLPSAWVKLIFSGTLLIVRECSDTRFTSQVNADRKEVRFAIDSMPEGGGFELPVRGHR